MSPVSPNANETGSPAAATPRRRAIDFRKYTKQIWLAGLGAFSRAEEEGTRLFDTLVQAGAELESKSSELNPSGEERASLSAQDGQDQDPRHPSLAGKVQDTRDRLERLLDEGLYQAMSRLGLPSGRDLQQLSQTVERLQTQIQQLTEEVQALRQNPPRD